MMRKKIAGLAFSFVLFLGIFAGVNSPNRIIALAASATPQTDEYENNSLVQYVEKTMNE